MVQGADATAMAGRVSGARSERTGEDGELGVTHLPFDLMESHSFLVRLNPSTGNVKRMSNPLPVSASSRWKAGVS